MQSEVNQKENLNRIITVPMARTVVYEIVCRTIIAERRGVRYVYSSNLQNKRFLYGQNA